MVNLFDFAVNDASLTYLTALFGNMNGIIPAQGGTSSATPTLTLMGAMFKTFNSAVLTVGALMVVYTTVVGVILTAHEGEFMGKKWNNLWIPLRMVIGIVLLVPTGSGFSMIQIIMMWVIVQGVGAADTLWNTVINYISLTGSPYASVSLSSVGPNQSIGILFQEINCHVASQKHSINPYPNSEHQGDYYCADPRNMTHEFCKKTGLPQPLSGSSTHSLEYQFGPGGNCGTFSVCDPSYACGLDQSVDANKLQCISCTAQSTGFTNIMGVLQSIATSYADADYAYANYYAETMRPTSPTGSPPSPPAFVQQYCTDNNLSECTQPGGLPSPGLGKSGADEGTIKNMLWRYALKPTLGDDAFIQTNVDYYMNIISDAVNAYISSLGSNNTATTDWQQNAMKTGWIFAGAYYYQIAQMSQSQFTSSIPTLTTVTPDTTNGPISKYRNNYSAAGILMSAATSAGGTSGGGVDLGQQVQITTAGLASTTSAFANLTGGNLKTNPIASLVSTGQTLLETAQALFGAYLLLSILMAIFGGFTFLAVGTGGNAGVGTGLTVGYMLLAPVILFFIGILVTMGGTMAVYVPLIPYMVFTFGAIAWLLLTVEAMVAGPLVALGILSPSGQHEMLGKSEPALLLIFGIFLRPSLMIFGMMAAMLLAYIVKSMIDAAYWNVIATISPKNAKNMLGQGGMIAYILIYITYVYFIISALNKCFAAIYIVPQQVMTWISGHAREGGEAAGLEETKGGFQRGAGDTGGFIGKGGLDTTGEKGAGALSKSRDLKKKPPTPSVTSPP